MPAPALCGLAALVGLTAGPEPSEVTRELFVAKCASCHSVGQGDRVGPDLKGCVQRRGADWVKRMIEAPSGLLSSDAAARALLAKYNNVRMPDLGLAETQAAALTDLLAYCSDNACALKGKFRPVTEATARDVAGGLALFLGTARQKTGGPACISCHSADGAGSLMGGGTLARNLTHSIARLGDEGLDAALRNPAFPLMNKVYQDRPLSEEEAFALRAFLNQANRTTALGDQREQHPLSVALLGTLLCAAALLALNFAWRRRLGGIRAQFVAKHGGRI